MLTVDDLRTDLQYQPDTGHFIRKPRDRSCFSTDRQFATRNARYSNKIAGSVRANGYRWIRGPQGRPYSAHRLAVFYMTGEWPEHEVDHINGNRDDNRWANLRCVTRSENMKNRKLGRSNQSGVPGVYFRKDSCRWGAFIGHKGDRVHLGIHPTKAEAIAARKMAERSYGFHANHGRAC